MLEPHQIKKEPVDKPGSERSSTAIPKTQSPAIKCTCKKKQLSGKTAPCNISDTNLHRQVLVNFGLTRKKIFTLSQKEDKLHDKFTSYVLSEPTFSKLLEDSYVVFQEFSNKFGTWVDIDQDNFIQDGTVLKAVFFPSVIERDDSNPGSIKRKIIESVSHKPKLAHCDDIVIDIDTSDDDNIDSSVTPLNNSSEEADLSKNVKQKKEKKKVNYDKERDNKKKNKKKEKDKVSEMDNKEEKGKKKVKQKKSVMVIKMEEEEEEEDIVQAKEYESQRTSENITDNITYNSSNKQMSNQGKTRQKTTTEIVAPSLEQTSSSRQYGYAPNNRFRSDRHYHSVYSQNSQGSKFYQNGANHYGRNEQLMKPGLNTITRLQHLCAKRMWPPPEFTSSEHISGWTSKCWISGIPYMARHKIKHRAEIIAAKKALYDLSNSDGNFQSDISHHNQNWT